MELHYALAIMAAIVGLEHLGIFFLEVWFSSGPLARKSFGISEDFMKNPEYQIMMANQGVYNLFLSVGIFWSLFEGYASTLIFFLCCVLVAGIFGAITVKRSIFFVQALPALLAIIFFFL